MNSSAEPGFSYLVETVKNGAVIESEVVHNLMPAEGAAHMLSATFKGGPQVATWYLGLYEGNYTPNGTDVAATFPALANETTTYAGATRAAFAPGAVQFGLLDNSLSRAEFAFSATKTVYGGFMTSAPAKGAAVGVLMSIVRFSSPRVMDADSILRVTAGISLTPV